MKKTDTKKQQQEFEFPSDHFAKNDHVKKLGLMFVPWSKLMIEDEFNDRVDYGTTEEMNELAESIYTMGPRVPLKGYKDGEYYVVLQGHRRHKAGEMIKKKYGEDVVFPFQTYSPGTTRKEMLLDTLLTNSGKDLTPLEKASTVDKLFKENMTEKEIAQALGGVSRVYVKNLQRLWAIPDELKKLIRNGTVSATMVMGYLKSKDANMEEFIAEIEKLAKEAGSESSNRKGRKKKQAKVTAKKTSKAKNSENGVANFKKFKKWLEARIKKDPEGNHVNRGSMKTYNFIVEIVENKASYQSIVDFFTK